MFMKVTTGKDLIPASLTDDCGDIQGAALLELTVGDNLYVKAVQQNTGNDNQQSQQSGSTVFPRPTPQSVTPQPTRQAGLISPVAPQQADLTPSGQCDQLLNKGVVHQQFLVGPQSQVYAAVVQDSTSNQLNKVQWKP
jgi:hypothetical protein